MDTALIELLQHLWKSQREESGARQAKIVISAAGFSVTHATGSGLRRQHGMPWGRLSEVIAFRIHHAGQFVTCLGIISKDAGVIVLDATMTGWPDFIGALEVLIPRAVPFKEWHTNLESQPASNTWTTIYETNF